jgi:hypothetical protein
MTILLFTINPGIEIVGQLPAGFVGEPYSATVSVRGGLGPYTMSAASVLPAGLTATDNGNGSLTIAGTPTVVFAGSVTVQARDGLQTTIQSVIPISVIIVP